MSTHKPVRGGQRVRLKDPHLKELSDFYERLRRGTSDVGRGKRRFDSLVAAADEDLALLREQLEDERKEVTATRQSSSLALTNAENQHNQETDTLKRSFEKEIDTLKAVIKKLKQDLKSEQEKKSSEQEAKD